MSGFQIGKRDVEALNSSQFQDLLRKLLVLEASSMFIPISGIHVPDGLDITVPDGGEDGRIEWENGPKKTEFIPNRLTQFQNKAQNMGPTACKNEVLIGGKIKPVINDVITSGGAYILFCKKTYTKKAVDERIKSIRQGFEIGGRKDFELIQVDFFDGNKIINWVNKFPSIVFWLREQLGTPPPMGVVPKSWDFLKGENKNRKFKFVEDESIKKQINEIKERLGHRNAILRIVGFPGIGKTRLTFEIFRPPASEKIGKNLKQKFISDKFIYVNAASSNESNLIQLFETLTIEKKEAIFVVDNCSRGLHEKISDVVTHRDSQLSFISLDYENPHQTYTQNAIILNKLSDEVILGINKQGFTILSQEILALLVEYSEGLPQLAVLLAEARMDNSENPFHLKEDIYKRMLWGHDTPNAETEQVRKGCALFKEVGVLGSVKGEYEEVATKVLGIDKTKFVRGCTYFKDKEIIQNAGDFILARPIPLAIHLAAEKLKEIHPDHLVELMGGGDVEKKLPDRLIRALCDRLKMLDFVDGAKEIVEELCEEKAPFGTAEVLNTEQGSLCFRNLVEVNPEITVQTLKREFGNWTRDQLLEVGSGRRNLVWALEKLCFRKETFQEAARLMLAFASAENESWGNNATGQFVGLYKLYLPGTEVPSSERWPIIDEVFKEKDPEKLKIAIKALEAGLQTFGFSRSGGAETQGSTTKLVDWRPKTIGERDEHYREALKRLIIVVKMNGELRNEATKIIAQSFRSLLQIGLFKEVEEAIEICTKFLNRKVWVEGLKSIKFYLDFDSEKAKPQQAKKAKYLYSKLLPKDLENKLKLYVTESSYFLYEDKESVKEMESNSESDLKKLASECSENPNKFFSFLPNLLDGNQSNAGFFGKVLAEHWPNKTGLARKIIETLKDGNLTFPNPSLLGGVLDVLQKEKPEQVSIILDEVLKDQNLAEFLVMLTGYIEVYEPDIERLTSAINTQKVSVNEIRRFSMGRIFKKMKPQSLEGLLEVILKQGKEGAWVVIDALAMYGYRDKKKLIPLTKTIEKAVLTKTLFEQGRDELHHLDTYHFGTLVKWKISEETTASFSRAISKVILSLSGKTDFSFYLDNSFKEIIEEMLKFFPRETWEEFGGAIIKGNSLQLMHLDELFGERRPNSENVLITNVPENILKEWCKKNPQKGPTFILEIYPTLELKPDKTFKFSSMIHYLLDNFGSEEIVLRGLQRNIHTYSWTGPISNYYKRFLDPLLTLKDHKIPKVKEWAESELKLLQDQIEAGEKREEHFNIGVY